MIPAAISLFLPVYRSPETIAAAKIGPPVGAVAAAVPHPAPILFLFVALTAVAINNRDLIAPGITTGILGHAVGNNLGVTVAGILSNWP